MAVEYDDSGRPVVSAHSSEAERTVFTEQDNSDGWISTDLTVTPRP
ncbi:MULTISPECIES: hypothetical protein [Haloarcula]|nr:hypothetical protein [Halomicroarcula sp. XH51]